MRNGRKQFLFVVPVFRSVDPEPFANFLAITLSAASKEHESYELLPHVPGRQLLHSLMNRACEIVIEQDFDGMIVADDDCGPPFDAVSQLLRRYEAGHPVVLGAGFMKNFPHTTTLGRYYPEGPTLVTNTKTGAVEYQGFYWLDDLDEEPSDDGLVPVDFGGFPIALISADAIRKIKSPWFGTEIDGGNCTHDVYFGYKCAKAGVPIVADLNIKCHHLSPNQWVTFENRRIVRNVHAAYKASQKAAL